MIQKFSKITLIFIFVNLYTLNILRLYSESKISFRTKLRGRYRYFSYIPGLYTGVGTHLSNISQQNSMYVITANLHQHIIIIQSPKFPLHFTFGVVHSMRFDKCAVTCTLDVHVHLLLQYHMEQFHCPKILCLPAIYSSLPTP